MKLKQLSCAVLTSLGAMASAHAVSSGQSDFTLLLLSPTAVEFGVDGQLGNATFGPSHFTGLIHAGLAGSYDAATGIYQFAGSDLSWLPPTAPDHTGLGVWAFKQVNSDLLIGNWATEVGTTKTADPATYTVFYIGDDTGTTVPTSGTADYTVTGINNGDALSGTYTANFTAGTLQGELSGSGTVTNLVIDATFGAGNATFSGDAVANSTVDGTTSGQFFGANAASLAGIAKFTDRQYDTAFGGVKQ